MKTQEINFVNLVGTMTSEPKVINMESGRRMVKFSLSTNETYLDENGNTQNNRNWHRVVAWGKWVPILNQLCTKGQLLAIEGRLKSRFLVLNGQRHSFTEVEINDLIIL